MIVELHTLQKSTITLCHPRSLRRLDQLLIRATLTTSAFVLSKPPWSTQLTLWTHSSSTSFTLVLIQLVKLLNWSSPSSTPVPMSTTALQSFPWWKLRSCRSLPSSSASTQRLLMVSPTQVVPCPTWWLFCSLETSISHTWEWKDGKELISQSLTLPDNLITPSTEALWSPAWEWTTWDRFLVKDGLVLWTTKLSKKWLSRISNPETDHSSSTQWPVLPSWDPSMTIMPSTLSARSTICGITSMPVGVVSSPSLRKTDTCLMDPRKLILFP